MIKDLPYIRPRWPNKSHFANMGVYGNEQTITEQLLFDLNECSKKLGRLRWNSDHTREIRSPSLAQIGKSTDFHELILLCSEHSPSIVRPILQNALSRCTESERQHKEFQVSKKREAEAQIGPDNHKQARLPQSRKDVFRAGSGHAPRLDEGKNCEPRVYQKELVSDVTPAVTETHDRDTIDGSNCVMPNSASGASEPSVPSKTIEVCQSRENTEGEHCVPDMGQGCVSAPQMSQEISQIKTTNSKVPTAYEIELGLVRGEKEIQKLVMDKCMSLSPSYRGTRWFSRENEVRAMFDVCRKLPPRIVKAWLLRELQSRIEVPGNRTEIPSTANMSNPSEILDALQCIKMTTINSKIHRAYGQMRLYEFVKDVIKKGKTPIDYLLQSRKTQY